MLDTTITGTPAIPLVQPTDDTDKLEDLMSGLLPKERAWALYCQGHRSPEIGSILHVPERTVRSWLTRALTDTEAERAQVRAYHLDLAIERQRQIAAAAWQGYERALAIAEAESAKAANTDSAANARAATQALSAAARYLTIAAKADRELARLHDTLAHAHDDMPSHDEITPRASTHSQDPSIQPIIEVQPPENAAKTATSDHQPLPCPPPKIEIAAKSATPPHVPLSSPHKRVALRHIM